MNVLCNDKTLQGGPWLKYGVTIFYWSSPYFSICLRLPAPFQHYFLIGVVMDIVCRTASNRYMGPVEKGMKKLFMDM